MERGGPLAEGRSKWRLKAIAEQGRRVFQAEKRAKTGTWLHKPACRLEGALGRSVLVEGRQQGAEAGRGRRQVEPGCARPTALLRSPSFVLYAQEPLRVLQQREMRSVEMKCSAK